MNHSRTNSKRKKTTGNPNYPVQPNNPKVAMKQKQHEEMYGEDYIALNEMHIEATRKVVKKMIEVLQPLLNKVGIIPQQKEESAVRQAFAIEEQLIKLVKSNYPKVVSSRQSSRHRTKSSEDYIVLDTDDSARTIVQKTMKVIQPLLDQLGEATAKQKQEAAAREALTMESQLERVVEVNYQKALQQQSARHKESSEELILMDTDDVTQTVVQKTMKVLEPLFKKLGEAAEQQKQEIAAQQKQETTAKPIFTMQDQLNKQKEFELELIKIMEEKIALKMDKIILNISRRR